MFDSNSSKSVTEQDLHNESINVHGTTWKLYIVKGYFRVSQNQQYSLKKSIKLHFNRSKIFPLYFYDVHL